MCYVCQHLPFDNAYIYMAHLFTAKAHKDKPEGIRHCEDTTKKSKDTGVEMLSL